MSLPQWSRSAVVERFFGVVGMAAARRALLGGALVAALSIAQIALAAVIPIVSYDALEVPMSGYGGWGHYYGGTITDLGIPFDNSGYLGGLSNETGGSGNLNDGVISNDLTETQLFVAPQATDGTPINPTITLNLGGNYLIEEIEIFGGDGTDNFVPGRIGALDIEIGGVPQAYNTSPFGNLMTWGGLQDDRITISGAQTNVATNQIVLSGFNSGSEPSEGGNLWFNFFSITEIRVFGEAVPEPSALMLATLGLLGVSVGRRVRV